MCETNLERVDNIRYKTIRNSGRMKPMNLFFRELLMRVNRKETGQFLVNAKPPVEDKIVYIHVLTEGENDGRLQQREFVRGFRPTEAAGASDSDIPDHSRIGDGGD